jgi:integrase
LIISPAPYIYRFSIHVGLSVNSEGIFNDYGGVLLSYHKQLVPVIGNAIATYITKDRPKTNLPYVFLSRVSPHGAIADHAGCYSVIKNIFQIAGIRIGSDKVKGTRLFRHSVASKMLENGVAVQTISSVLGHSNPSTTDVYITTHKEKMRQCALPVSVIPMNVRGLN